MSGLIGGSSANTDRATQLSGQQGLWNIFSYGLDTGKAGQTTGQSDLNTAKSTLGQASDYWSSLLSGGRTQTAQRSAPSINQTLENATATRNAEGTFGTGRTGGTVAANREASTQTQSKIDDIINNTLQTGRTQGAQGLQTVAGEQAQIGGTELSNALSLLGLSESSVKSIMENATDSRKTSYEINRQTQEDWGSAVGQLLTSLHII